MIAKGFAAFSMESVDFPGGVLMWQVHMLLGTQFSSKMEKAIAEVSEIFLWVQKQLDIVINLYFAK